MTRTIRPNVVIDDNLGARLGIRVRVVEVEGAVVRAACARLTEESTCEFEGVTSVNCHIVRRCGMYCLRCFTQFPTCFCVTFHFTEMFLSGLSFLIGNFQR